jgi:coenzyme F420-0:L-glutamate ligase / coenzyme F420-1:gamma-L-glutamate ligase
MMASSLSLTALPGLPLIVAGDDLAGLIATALGRAGIVPANGDVVVVAQKIVSKAEGRSVDLADVVPSECAKAIGKTVRKDPRLVELILAESTEIVRQRPDVLIVAHRLGYVMANAGVDQSNVSHEDGESALLLPIDPDASAADLKARLDALFNVDLGVVINDSFGRPWRNGVVGVALGAAGLPSLRSCIGAPDLFGRRMRMTEIAVADQVAAAASLVMGETDEGLPAVHVRGLAVDGPSVPASALVRPKEMDLFR